MGPCLANHQSSSDGVLAHALQSMFVRVGVERKIVAIFTYQEPAGCGPLFWHEAYSTITLAGDGEPWSLRYNSVSSVRYIHP